MVELYSSGSGSDTRVKAASEIHVPQGVASLALRRGQLKEAREAVEPVVQMFERRGMRIGILVNALRLRAEICWRQGDLAAATSDARRALAIAMELQGGNPHSSFTGLSWLLLGRLDRESGDLKAADTAFQNAIPHLSNALGDDHPQDETCAPARRVAAHRDGTGSDQLSSKSRASVRRAASQLAAFAPVGDVRFALRTAWNQVDDVKSRQILETVIHDG